MCVRGRARWTADDEGYGKGSCSLIGMAIVCILETVVGCAVSEIPEVIGDAPSRGITVKVYAQWRSAIRGACRETGGHLCVDGQIHREQQTGNEPGGSLELRSHLSPSGNALGEKAAR